MNNQPLLTPRTLATLLLLLATLLAIAAAPTMLQAWQEPNEYVQEDYKDSTINTYEDSTLSELEIRNSASFEAKNVVVEVCGYKRECGNLSPKESRKIVFPTSKDSSYKISIIKDSQGGLIAALGKIYKNQKCSRTIEISDNLIRLLD
jgi:hypothetical protein